jgi:RHS repeat-associated protein
MLTRLCGVLFLICIFLIGSAAPAQVLPGAPPYSSISGGPVDSVNLANLNVHYDFTVLHKSGRGMPFNMDATYDTSIWYPLYSGGSWYWQGVKTAGWTESSLALGSLYGDVQLISGVYYYCDFIYYDGFGTGHPFPGPANPAGYPCPANSNSTSPQKSAAVDGSGYILTLSNFSGASLTAQLNSREGNYIVPPVGTQTGSGHVVDRNGNTVSFNATTNVYTDTLGLPAITVGSGTNATTYSYTSPAGTSATVTMAVKSYTIQTKFACSGIAEYGPQTGTLMDRITLPDGSYYQFTYEATPGVSGAVTGRLASIKLPTEGTISYTYTGINCGDGSAAGMNRTTPDGTWTYHRTLGSGNSMATLVTDPQGNQTIIQFQGIYETQRDVYSGSAPSFSSVPISQSALQTSNLLQETRTCYNGSASPCTGTAVSLPITQKNVIVQLGANGRQSQKVYSYPTDGSGVLLEEDDYDYGSGARGSLLKKTVYAYDASLGAIKSFPATVTVCAPGGTASACGGSGTVVAQTTNKYDENAMTPTSGTPQWTSVGSNPRGNLTTVTSLSQGTATLKKTLSYYDTGNVNTATDVNGAVTTYNYSPSGSCGNSFVTSVNEPLGLTKSMTWNCTGGVQTSLTDVNGKTTTTAYTDSQIWRPASITDPTNSVLNYSYQSETSAELTLTFNSGNSTVDIVQSLDGLGRSSLQQTRQAPGSANFDSKENDYDSLGRIRRTTLPYAGTLGQTNSSAAARATVYDALGRVLSVTDAGSASTSYTYVQNDVLVVLGPAPSGENTKQRQLEYDGLGRLTSVCEITSSSGSGACGQSVSKTGFWTKYAYDSLGNLVGVTQNAQAASASQQTRSYAYDGLNRLTSETNPESATTKYTYDTDATCGIYSGDKVKRIDAVGNTTCYSYDALHRNTSITYSGPYAGNTPNKYFAFDTATIATTPSPTAMVNAAGRLAEAYTATCQTCAKLSDVGFSYSVRGEVSDIYQATSHSSGYYHLNEVYWANGVPSQLSGNLGVPTLNYGVDGEGRSNSASTSSLTLVSGTTYNVMGQPTQLNLGTGDSDTYGYDSNTSRMTQYKFNVDSQAVIGNLTWNANATLQKLAITDPFNASDNQTCTYGYDDVTRIANIGCVPPGSTTASAWQQSFSYDAFGNISKSGSMSFQPTYTDLSGHTNNEFTSVPGCTVSYDANGNVLNDCTHSYTWDAEGHPITTDGINLTYDALQRMVEQNRSGAYTQLVYGPTGEKFALMTAQTVQKAYVSLPGKLTAVYTTAGFSYYRHKDWLGSSRFASTTTLSTTAGLGTSTVNGSEQSKAVGAAPGTGSVTVGGSEKSTTSGTHSTGSYYFNLYSPSSNLTGTITLTINGANLASYPFSSGMSGCYLAQQFSNQINGNSAALVTSTYVCNQGSSAPGTINLTSKAVGSNTNYPLSVSCSNSCSSYTTASGMSGGTGTTVYDTGSVWVTVNGVQTSVSYGQTSTSSSLANSLVSAINGNSSLPVTATLSGSIVNLTAKTTGSSTDYTLSSGSSTNQPSTFSSPSFSVSNSGSTLTGGSNGTVTYDTGTAWITVNGIQTSVSYGQNDTPLSVASSLANAINGNGSSQVSATVSGSLIVLVSKAKGSGTNYSLASGSSTNQPANFSSPSFSVALSGSALTGGTASAASMYSSTAYAPFGETYAQAGTADASFAGLNQDTVGGLYDADAREYSTQGRWPSPDPAGVSSMHLSDPQTLNRYTYSRNNPVSLSDPTGMDWCDWFGGCGFGGGGLGCDWDPSCFGGSLPNPFGGLPDPWGISNVPMPGTGCDWGCLSAGSGDGNTGNESIANADPGTDNCPSDKRRFFDWLDEPLGRMADNLNVPQWLLFNLAAKEGGWTDKNLDHNQPLNNPFGVNKICNGQPCGNIQYKSLDDAINKWEDRFGDAVRDADTRDQFVYGLMHMPDGTKYNADQKGWTKKFNEIDVQKWMKNCGVS